MVVVQGGGQGVSIISCGGGDKTALAMEVGEGEAGYGG